MIAGWFFAYRDQMNFEQKLHRKVQLFSLVNGILCPLRKTALTQTITSVFFALAFKGKHLRKRLNLIKDHSRKKLKKTEIVIFEQILENKIEISYLPKSLDPPVLTIRRTAREKSEVVLLEGITILYRPSIGRRHRASGGF